MKKIFCLLLLFTSLNAYSSSPFWAGVGSTTHNFLTAQTDEKGTSKVVEFAPTIIVGFSLPFFSNGLLLTPGFGYAQYFTKDKTTKSEFILQYHLAQQLSSWFYIHYGFSNYMTKIGGEGGDIVLNNGSGTATFYVPSSSKTTYTASVDLGGELLITSNMSTRLQFSLLRFLSSERRRVSHLLTANYFF
jgi:hypothetical protein